MVNCDDEVACLPPGPTTGKHHDPNIGCISSLGECVATWIYDAGSNNTATKIIDDDENVDSVYVDAIIRTDEESEPTGLTAQLADPARIRTGVDTARTIPRMRTMTELDTISRLFGSAGRPVHTSDFGVDTSLTDSDGNIYMGTSRNGESPQGVFIRLLREGKLGDKAVYCNAEQATGRVMVEQTSPIYLQHKFGSRNSRVLATTPPQCCSICGRHSRCVAYEFIRYSDDPDNPVCMLHTTPTGATASVSAIEDLMGLFGPSTANVSFHLTGHFINSSAAFQAFEHAAQSRTGRSDPITKPTDHFAAIGRGRGRGLSFSTGRVRRLGRGQGRGKRETRLSRQTTFELQDKHSNVTKARGRFDTIRMMMNNHAAGLLDDFQGAELSRAFSAAAEGTTLHTYANSFGTGEDSRRLSEGSSVRYFAIFASPPASPPPSLPPPVPPPVSPLPEVSCQTLEAFASDCLPSCFLCPLSLQTSAFKSLL